MNFLQFWDRINGPAYSTVPPPVRYDLASYQDQITSGPISNVEGGGAELRPLTRGDTARYAAADVEEWYAKHGRNSNRLGPPMTDLEFKKFLGQTW